MSSGYALVITEVHAIWNSQSQIIVTDRRTTTETQYNKCLERHLPAYQKLLTALGLGTNLSPDIHGEYCRSRVEYWSQVTHKSWQHDREHNASHPIWKVFQHEFWVCWVRTGHTRTTELQAFLWVHTPYFIRKEDTRDHACQGKGGVKSYQHCTVCCKKYNNKITHMYLLNVDATDLSEINDEYH